MTRTLTVPMSALALVAVCALPCHAQRGGGARGFGGGSSTEEAVTRTSFESPDKTLAFTVPPDVTLFTPDMPGRFFQVFKAGYMAYLINLVNNEVTIGIKAMPGATEADLAGLRRTLDTTPPQAKQPGYKKISVGSAKVGVNQDKDSLDYVYTAQNSKNQPFTTRQVMFLHAGKGYVVTCTAPEKEFASANKKTFDALFHKLELR